MRDPTTTVADSIADTELAAMRDAFKERLLKLGMEAREADEWLDVLITHAFEAGEAS